LITKHFAQCAVQQTDILVNRTSYPPHAFATIASSLRRSFIERLPIRSAWSVDSRFWRADSQRPGLRSAVRARAASRRTVPTTCDAARDRDVRLAGIGCGAGGA